MVWPFVIVGLIVAFGVVSRLQHPGVDRLVSDVGRAHNLVPTDTPVGMSTTELAGMALLPAGARRRTVTHGLSAVDILEVAGQPVRVEACAFEWTWETADLDPGRDQRMYGLRTIRAVVVAFPGPVGVAELSASAGVHAPDGRTRSLLEDPALTDMLAMVGDMPVAAFRDDHLVVVDLRELEGGRAARRPARVYDLVGMRQAVMRLVNAIPATYWTHVGLVGRDLPGHVDAGPGAFEASNPWERQHNPDELSDDDLGW